MRAHLGRAGGPVRTRHGTSSRDSHPFSGARQCFPLIPGNANVTRYDDRRPRGDEPFAKRVRSLDGRLGAVGHRPGGVYLLDTALLLFIGVEVFLTIAYSRQRKVTRIVIGTGLIAIARGEITFHVGGCASPRGGLVAAGAYGRLILVLVAGWYAVRDPASDAEPV